MGYFTQAKQSRSQQPKPTAKRCFIWCSKCHINPRPPADKPSNFDKSAFDRWCSSCYANTPLIERSRKCSRGEKNKLLQRQQEAREKLTKERAEVMAARLAKMEEAKKKRRGTTAKPKRKKGDDEPFTLDLDYSFLNDDSSSSGERLETDYDRMRRLTAKVSDPTIYQEALENKTHD